MSYYIVGRLRFVGCLGVCFFCLPVLFLSGVVAIGGGTTLNECGQFLLKAELKHRVIWWPFVW